MTDNGGRLTYTDTLARLDERLKGVERRLDEPMKCIEGALVAQRLEQVSNALKGLASVREEDYRSLTAHERRIQRLEDGVQVRVARIAVIAATVGGVVTLLGQIIAQVL